MREELGSALEETEAPRVREETESASNAALEMETPEDESATESTLAGPWRARGGCRGWRIRWYGVVGNIFDFAGSCFVAEL
jgi:hypothetical protein